MSPRDAVAWPAAALLFLALPAEVPATMLAQSTMQASREALELSSNMSAQLPVGAVTEPETVSYLLKTLTLFNGFSAKAEKEAEDRHAREEASLQATMQQTSDEGVRLALQQSLTASKQSLLETTRIYKSMGSFSGAVATLLRGTTSKGHGCEQVECGEHASCTTTTAGAECVCNEGYVGQGSDCRAPPEFMPHRLVLSSVGGSTTRVADMNVCVFGRNKVAVVYRDVPRHAGHIIVGSVREAGTADLAPPEQFTAGDGKAFNPIAMGTANKRLAIAWRDENRAGTCWVRGAVLGATGIRGADMAISWGDKVNFCQNQAHELAFVSFPDDHFAILFPDKVQVAQTTAMQSFGNSLLANVGERGEINVRGKFRFTEHAVCRLQVTKITPTAFVLAGRAAKAVDDLDASVSTQQEAMAMYGEMVDNDLVFDPNPVNLEPKSSQIWARGVSLVAPNTVAYAYQDGTTMQMKMAILEVSPLSHRLEVVQQPSALRAGFSPYVSMLSVPYTPSDPHTLVYYEDEVANASMVNLCSWSAAQRKFSRCEDFAWLNQRLSSVSGVHLGGGRSFLVYAPRSGIPYYGVFGLSKK